MSAPVLELRGARPDPAASPLRAAVELRLRAGDLALVHADDPELARALAALCAGLPKLVAGRACFLGQDWAGLPRRQAEALRARIGLAPGQGGWLPHLTVAEGMLLARRHHGAQAEAALRDEADALARRFGLDGLPAEDPYAMPHLDLARAACARAFLGRPALLLLESPLDIEVADALVAPLRAALEPAMAAGAAAIWVTRSRRAWQDPGFPARHRLRLDETGLAPAEEAVP